MTTKTKKAQGTRFVAGELRAAIGVVLKAVPTRSAKPILANVKIGDGLVTGTDLELRIDHEIDYHGDAILLPAARLHQILGTVPADAEVTITPGDTSCRIRAGHGEWTIPTESAAEFPDLSASELSAVCRLPGDQFARAIRATAYATDTESSRYALGAILLTISGGNPTLVATDGRRMACVECETDQAVDDRDILLPVAAAEIAAGNHGDSVQIETDGKVCVFTTGRVTVTGRIVEGRFPKWRDVIPSRELEPWSFDRSQLLSGVRAAAIVTSEQSKGVQFVLHDDATLKAQSAESGESIVSVDHVEPGRRASVSLDPAFVSDFLRSLDSDADPYVSIDAAGVGDAVLLTCDDVRAVIMPLAKD